MLRRTFVLIALGGTLRAAAAAGQTTFEWPKDTVNVERYTTFEECQILVWRLRDDALLRERLTTRISWDTMPYDPRTMRRWRRDEWPDTSSLAEVRKAAQRCLAPFSNVDSAPPERFQEYFEMYLHAGWDAKIQELVDREMARAGPNEAGTVLDTIIDLGNGFGFKRWNLGRGRPWGTVAEWYGKARWVALLETILTRHAAKEPNPVKRALLYTNLLTQWESGRMWRSWGLLEPQEDSVGAVQAAQRVVKFIQGTITTDAERKDLADSLGLGDEPLDNWLRDIADLGRIKARFSSGRDLDSLRKSTAAYVAAWRAIVSNSIVGDPAPPVHADAWAWGGLADSTDPRPRRGHVSLLVFFEGDGDLGGGYCFTGGGGPPTTVVGLRKNCAEEMIALRRLADRFPSLEITMVAPAHGYFKYLKPTTPAQEAELTRELATSYGLKIPVGVMNLPPNWLPTPDGRRVEQLRSADANWQHYIKRVEPKGPPPGISERLRKAWERAQKELPRLYGSTIMLVDQDGIIVDVGQLTREDAGAMAPRIEILVNRRPASP